MRSGTGPKIRKIKAAKAGVDETFEFNKSIVPRGGTSARMQIKQNNKGSLLIKIFQDKNNNENVSRRELIYKGISQKDSSDDRILNFNGKIHLSKQMHMCEWLAQTKRPAEVCTLEYIPTIYDCRIITDAGETFNFNGVGDFKSDLIEISPNDFPLNA